MSETDSRLAPSAAQSQMRIDDSADSGASNATPADLIRRPEHELSPPPPPPPETEDEETESEIEMEIDDDGEPILPPPPETPPRASPASAQLESERNALDDAESEEEEDEEYPPLQPSPSNGEESNDADGDDASAVSAPPRSQHDEETKAHDADDDADDASPVKKGVRQKTQVDVEPDAELIRVLASASQRMAAADKKRLVWEDLFKQLSHRFKTWRAMQARYSWLQIVLRDPAHGEYAKLTDEMKRLMKEFNVATGAIKAPRASPKRRTRIGFVDPAKRRKVAQLEGRLERAASSSSPRPTASDKSTSAGDKGAGAAAPPTPPKGRDKLLDSAAEETLMRAANKVAPEFRRAENKMAVWDKIAEASRGRYVTGAEARHQIRWLVKVFRESGHPQHSRLSPELRELLTKFLDVTGQPLIASGPTTPRSVNEKGTGAPSKFVERKESSNKTNGTQKKVARVTIRPKGDEKLAGLVLEKRPFASSAAAATAIWDEIAVALTPTHPKITDGTSAMARFNTILKVYNDATHPNHNDFTKTLGDKLSNYNQIMNSFRAKLSVLKNKSLQDDSSEASAEEVRIVKPRALGEGADLPIIPKPSASAARRSSRSMAVEDTSKSVDADEPHAVELETRVPGRRPPPLPLNPEVDELLMRKLLEKRPWDIDRYDKKAIAWNEIVLAVKDKNPRIKNGVGAQGRVRWLQGVLETPSHDEHPKLTSTLRELITEYNEVYSKHLDAPSGKERIAKSVDSHDEANVSTQDSKKRKEPSDIEVKEPSENPAPSPKRTRGRTSETRDKENGAALELSPDDVLLLETLRSRPFHSRRGDGMAAWDEVATAVDQSTGRQTFRTGGKALARLKRMLASYRQGVDLSDVQLTPQQSKMLKLVEELLKVKWPKNESFMTDEHHGLVKQIDQFLEERPQLKSGLVAGELATAELIDAPNISSKFLSLETNDTDLDDEQLPEMRIVPQSYKEVEKLRRQLAEMTKQRDAALASQKQLDARHEQVDALQDEIIRLRSAAASDRASFESHTQSLQDEIASCRAQLTTQTARLEEERREHRDELRAMVEMLQAEREAHERDTNAMLAVVHRERDDRREEFVAMMNLVTRSVLQAEEPTAQEARYRICDV